MTDEGRLHVTDAELRVLELLWQRGPSPIRDLLAANPELGWAYTTLQTLLQRLVSKGLVSRQDGSRAAVYAPAMSREDLLQRQLGDLATRLADGSVLPLFRGLVAGRRLQRSEVDELRRLLDAAEGRNARDPAPRSRRKPQ